VKSCEPSLKAPHPWYSQSPELSESTVLSLNMNYNSKRSKFKMIGQMKDTVQVIITTDYIALFHCADVI